MRTLTAEDVHGVEWLLRRCDARLLELQAPVPVDAALARLHSAVVGGLIQCSKLREQMLGEPAAGAGEDYEDCA